MKQKWKIVAVPTSVPIREKKIYIRLKSGTLKGLTDHIRILHIGCLLGVFDLDVRLFFPILAQKRPGPTDEERKNKKPSFPWSLVKKNDFGKCTQKSHDSSRKDIKNIILPRVLWGTDKIFCFVDFHLGVPPKNWRYLVFWPKNDAKQEKEKKKENVGFFSVNSSFFLARKKT